jgi:hypothetical protein
MMKWSYLTMYPGEVMEEDRFDPLFLSIARRAAMPGH